MSLYISIRHKQEATAYLAYIFKKMQLLQTVTEGQNYKVNKPICVQLNDPPGLQTLFTFE